MTVDREGGIDLDTLASASKAISAAIDREDVGPPSRYELEVSSPGLERRLRRPEHFRRFVGHKVAFGPCPGSKASGGSRARSSPPTTDGVVVTAPGLPEGGRRLAYGDIERAHTVFDWRAALARTASPTARSDRRRRPRRRRRRSRRDSAQKEMADKL